MAGTGTGYPIWFVCPVARRNREWHGPSIGRLPSGHSKIVRTGRTKPASNQNKGHPRKLRESHEYVCQCGHRGWTSHTDITKYPVDGTRV